MTLPVYIYVKHHLYSTHPHPHPHPSQPSILETIAPSPHIPLSTKRHDAPSHTSKVETVSLMPLQPVYLPATSVQAQQHHLSLNHLYAITVLDERTQIRHSLATVSRARGRDSCTQPRCMHLASYGWVEPSISFPALRCGGKISISIWTFVSLLFFYSDSQRSVTPGTRIVESKGE